MSRHYAKVVRDVCEKNLTFVKESDSLVFGPLIDSIRGRLSLYFVLFQKGVKGGTG